MSEATATKQHLPSAPPAKGRLTATGALLLAAGSLALVGNLVHPRFSGDAHDVYRQIAGSSAFAVADVILLFALMILVAGLTGLVSDVRESSSSARLGYLAALGGGVIAVAQTGVELYGYRQQAKVFVDIVGARQDGAYWATGAIDGMNAALFATWTVVLLGLAPVLISLALASGRGRWRWLDVVGVVAGLICGSVGVYDLLHADQSSANVPFLAGSLLFTFWVLGTGWLMVAKSRR